MPSFEKIDPTVYEKSLLKKKKENNSNKTKKAFHAKCLNSSDHKD